MHSKSYLWNHQRFTARSEDKDYVNVPPRVSNDHNQAILKAMMDIPVVFAQSLDCATGKHFMVNPSGGQFELVLPQGKITAVRATV